VCSALTGRLKIQEEIDEFITKMVRFTGEMTKCIDDEASKKANSNKSLYSIFF